MDVRIYQGSSVRRSNAEIVIIIDVIRAFTVAHQAFLNGVKQILLAKTIEEALKVKEENPHALLAGEENGLPIQGFDLDNSPYHVNQTEALSGKVLIQKTTNGVRAALNNIHAPHVFVTGFSNARTTALYIKKYASSHNINAINIIASHPNGDDDLACAEYMKDILENANKITSEQVRSRIKDSHVADKFYDKNNLNFLVEDMDLCLIELNTNFVMMIKKTNKTPMIERVYV